MTLGQVTSTTWAPPPIRMLWRLSRGQGSRRQRLADELSDATDHPESVDGGGNDRDLRRLEGELKASKDQNKALTLYINKIIERLLQHQEFEHILDQSGDFKTPDVNKELPPPPPLSN